MNDIVFVNQTFISKDKATLSIFDRGLLFGDGVYEVIPFYDGKLAFLDKHLARLDDSLAFTKITKPSLNLKAMFQQLIDENGNGDGQLYLQITRGNQMARKHDIPPELTPTVIAFIMRTPFPTELELNKGLSAKLIEDTRWHLCHIKSTSLLGTILLNDEAVSQGANTAILHRDGIVTEGSSSNVFIVDKNNTIVTPYASHHILNGIARQVILDIIAQLNYSIEVRDIKAEELYSAQEIWITGSTKEVFPVVNLDNKTIPSCYPDALWRSIHKRYHALTRG